MLVISKGLPILDLDQSNPCYEIDSVLFYFIEQHPYATAWIQLASVLELTLSGALGNNNMCATAAS